MQVFLGRREQKLLPGSELSAPSTRGGMSREQPGEWEQDRRARRHKQAGVAGTHEARVRRGRGPGQGRVGHNGDNGLHPVFGSKC